MKPHFKSSGNGTLEINEILPTIIASTTAVMPFAVIRALILILFFQMDKFSSIHLTQIMFTIQKNMYAFVPILINSFYSAYWAMRSRNSTIQSITISLVSLFIVTGISEPSGNIFLNTSIPVAVLVAIFSNLSINAIVIKLNNIKSNVKLPHFIFPFISIIFGVLITLIICTPLSACINYLMQNFAMYLYPDNFIHGMVYEFVRGFSWFLGFHGPYMFNEIGHEFLNASITNMKDWHSGNAHLNILSPTFFDSWCSAGGCGNTLSLMICLIILRRHSYGNVTKLSLPLTIFNINEPLIFGVPIVLNPIMLVPFILSPQINYAIAYYGTLIGLIPRMQEPVSWITPPVVNVWLASGGSINSVLLQIFLIALGVLVYFPFLIYMEKREKTNIILPGGTQFKITSEKYSSSNINPINLDFIHIYNPLKQVNGSIKAKRKIQELEKSGEFILYFQPQVSLKNRKIIGLEVLLRHRSYTGVVIPPVFLRYYEQLGLMAELDFWVLETAVIHIHQYLSNFQDMVLAINISPQTLTDCRFLSVLDNILKKPLPGNWKIELEITESQQVLDPERTKEILEKLHQRNIFIALDDFGTGYSSISYLLSYNLDKIKLDRSLVQGMLQEGGVDFFNHVVKLCHSRHHRILMEGIETEAEYQYGCKANVEYGQGYYFYRPLSREDVCEVLAKHKSN